jgi:hypothetical protein
MSIEKARERLAAELCGRIKSSRRGEEAIAMAVEEVAREVARSEIARSAGGGEDVIVPASRFADLFQDPNAGILDCGRKVLLDGVCYRADDHAFAMSLLYGTPAPIQSAPAAEGGEPVVIGYTNHRGEFAERRIHPMNVWYGSTKWHPERQWFLDALDYDKGEYRDFALKDIGTATARVSELEAKRDAAKTAAELKEICLKSAEKDRDEWVRAAITAESSLAALRDRVKGARAIVEFEQDFADNPLRHATATKANLGKALALLTDPAPRVDEPPAEDARGDDSPVLAQGFAVRGRHPDVNTDVRPLSSLKGAPSDER